MSAAEVGTDPPEMAVAVEILCEGYVQSYVDFFKLVNRKEHLKKNALPHREVAEEGKDEEDAHLREINFLKSTLTKTEQAQRNGSTALLYESYIRLAKRFEEQDDAETSVYFYTKCLEIACSTHDPTGELRANRCLGIAHASLRNFKLAVGFHEREFAMSKDYGLEEKRASGTSLIDVYQLLAAELEENGTSEELSEAISILQSCLTTAQAVYDRKAQDDTSYSLARVYVKIGQPEFAVSILTNYIESCKIQHNEPGEGAGYSVLSAAYISMKDTQNAVMFLERCLEISERTGNARVQGEANRNLGIIYNNLGKFDRAAENFEKYFEISRMSWANQNAAAAAAASAAAEEHCDSPEDSRHDQNSEQKTQGRSGNDSSVASGNKMGVPSTGTETVNVARTLLGVARGNAYLGSFTSMLDSNISGLLAWKDERKTAIKT